MKRKEKIKNVKGITLVSVAVTIIVLIILAGIAINTAIGKNGILTIAKQSKENLELEQMEKQTKLNELYTQVKADTIATDTSSTDLNELIIRVANLEDKVKTIDEIYPVGSIYISTNISTAEEVASKLGGTWVSYGQGKTLIGVGTGTDINSTEQTFAANESGGEYNHTLTVAEMPTHNHQITDTSGRVLGLWQSSTSGGSNWPIYSYGNAGIGMAISANTGNSETHNNIQPYITVYMWKRIS